MGEYTSWVQMTITAALLGLVFAAIKSGLKSTVDAIKQYVEKELNRMDADLKTEVGRMDGKVEVAHKRIDDANMERRTEYLLESKHALLCSNKMHEVKEHITISLNSVFDAIRAIDKKIDKLDGRTGFLKDKQQI